jgi:hypothetical protein
LGSRQTGGPIAQTGNYTLHAGEYVLPPNVVSAIKENRAPSSSPLSAPGAGGGSSAVINVNINAPFSGAPAGADVKRITREIADAARRGVVWAVDYAKINYKIGRQKAGEAGI